jgi:hypothetical protein
MHTKFGGGTPYVALNLMICPYPLKQGRTVHAVFEFSIYNHSNGMYYGCEGSLMNLFIQAHPSNYGWVSIVLCVLYISLR